MTPQTPSVQILAALRPMLLLPHGGATIRPSSVAALKRVKYLRVAKYAQHNDRAVFTVDIYYRDAHSRIPVHHAQLLDAKRTTANPTVVRRIPFDDFLQLRYDAYELARVSHDDRRACAFCQRVMFLNATSSLAPRWTTLWFKSSTRVSGMLTAYLTEMLQLMEHIPVNSVMRCQGSERIPWLLQLFLRCYELALL